MPLRYLSYQCQRNKKTTELFGLGCPFIWRRLRDSNPRGFWPNGFQDRLVVTASISLRMNLFIRRGYRRGSENYFGIRFATFDVVEIILHIYGVVYYTIYMQSYFEVARETCFTNPLRIPHEDASSSLVSGKCGYSRKR